MPQDETKPEGNGQVEEQVREQTGQQQVRLRVDERNMTTTYANAFRTHAMPEEVLLDFGLNQVIPAPQKEGSPEIVLQVKNRVIMNYFTAKRLAIMLSQVIRRHEQDFGELELDVRKRRTTS